VKFNNQTRIIAGRFAGTTPCTLMMSQVSAVAVTLVVPPPSSGITPRKPYREGIGISRLTF